MILPKSKLNKFKIMIKRWLIYPLTDLFMALPKFDKPAAREAKNPPVCFGSEEAIAETLAKF